MFSGGQSSDSKSRQSSGGRSFFGRKKEKSTESRPYEDLPPTPGLPRSESNSVQGSKSSRHSRRPSDSVDMSERGTDAAGLHMTAGVITSIPYDSVSANKKTPIPVEYLPRQDQVPVRKEPLPHHLNKGGGDFHQYPAWDPAAMPTTPRTAVNGSSHPTGPRPPPHVPLSVTASMRDSSLRDRHSHKSAINPASTLQNTSSYSTAESSHNGRNSFDQASVHSTVSSHTGRSSIFTSEDTPRPAMYSNHTDHNTLRPTSSQSSATAARHSTASTWNGKHVPNYSSATSFTPDGFHLPRPSDDAVIEQQFVALMHKRGWQNLPDQARRQMMAYPPGKKWTLVHQDRLTEWQGEQKRRQNARQTLGAGADGNAGILARADEEGSPEWYVKKILDDSIDAKQLQSLSVSLRTQPIK